MANISVVTSVVRRSSGENSSAKLGRLSVPASRFCCHAGDSGRNGRMMIKGMAGITPDISVYRQAACGSLDFAKDAQDSGIRWRAGRAPRLPPARWRSPRASRRSTKTPAYSPALFSRCLGSGKSSASQATAATNSTQTPTNTRQRNTSSIHRRSGEPAAKAANAYTRMLHVSTRRRPSRSVRYPPSKPKMPPATAGM